MVNLHTRNRFSLTELLVIVGVLLLLAALLFPVLRNTRQRARYARWTTYQRNLRYQGNLVAYYTFEDGGGSKLENQATAPEGFRHYKPENYNGTLSGNLIWEQGRWTRKRGIRFTSSADHITCGTFDINKDHSAVDSASIVASFRMDNIGNFDTRIIGKSTGSEVINHLFMLGTTWQGGETRIRAMIKTDAGSTVVLIASSGDIREGDWVHAAVTYDGKRMVLYHDGKEVTSRALTGKIETNSSAKVTIGGLDDGGQSFTGLIDEIAIFNASLSTDDITESYKIGAP